MLFIQYYVEYFEDDAEMFWFPQFKRLVRAMFKLMNTSDLDYEATKKICRAQDIMRWRRFVIDTTRLISERK